MVDEPTEQQKKWREGFETLKENKNPVGEASQAAEKADKNAVDYDMQDYKEKARRRKEEAAEGMQEQESSYGGFESGKKHSMGNVGKAREDSEEFERKHVNFDSQTRRAKVELEADTPQSRNYGGFNPEKRSAEISGIHVDAMEFERNEIDFDKQSEVARHDEQGFFGGVKRKFSGFKKKITEDEPELPREERMKKYKEEKEETQAKLELANVKKKLSGATQHKSRVVEVMNQMFPDSSGGGKSKGKGKGVGRDPYTQSFGWNVGKGFDQPNSFFGTMSGGVNMKGIEQFYGIKSPGGKASSVPRKTYRRRGRKGRRGKKKEENEQEQERRPQQQQVRKELSPKDFYGL